MRSPFGVVDVREDDTIAGFLEAPLLQEWVNSGVYVLDDECIERLPERGDHELSTFPELATEGKLVAYRNTGFWLTVNTPKQLREASDFMAAHPELAPRARAGAVSLDSPNVDSLDAWAFDPRRVEKPWGWELIWAEAPDYVGKVLFVKAGESLSLQFHNVKDESWYVESGRARLELGAWRDGAQGRGHHRGRGVPLPAGHRPPRHGARGHADHRGLDAAPRRCRSSRRSVRPRGNVGTLNSRRFASLTRGASRPAGASQTLDTSVLR